jgi:hypothetical protein
MTTAGAFVRGHRPPHTVRPDAAGEAHAKQDEEPAIGLAGGAHRAVQVNKNRELRLAHWPCAEGAGNGGIGRARDRRR